MTTNPVISDSERYDRQIRVWGAEAQSRLQNSKVLICGLQNLNVEVVKNLVLAGVNVVLQDDHQVCEGDFANNFFLTDACLGANVVEASLANIKSLNNFVQLDYTTKPLTALEDDYFHQFQVISYAGGDEDQAIRIDKICRNQKIVFFWNDCNGENGIFFSDFGENFEYKEDPKAGNTTNPSSSTSSASSENKPAAVTLQQISFPSLESVLQMKWKQLPSRFFPLSKIFVQFRLLHSYRSKHHRNPTRDELSALRNVYEELVLANEVNDTAFESQAAFQDGLLRSEQDFLAICQSIHPLTSYGLITTVSVLGSMLSQEIIKAISLTGIPGFNVFLFEGANYSVKAIPIKP